MTDFGDVGRYSKPQPSLLSDTDSVLRPWNATDGAVKEGGMDATLYILQHDQLLLAGFFSSCLCKHQVTWLPCEVEALSIAKAVNHLAPYIIQVAERTHVLTDSRPCVLAYNKLCRGEFSNSVRVTSFLSTASRYQVVIGHIAGSANLPSDYASRNPVACQDSNCQVCTFVLRHQLSAPCL